MNIVLYRTATCPKCKVLEAKLKQKNIPFTECLDAAIMTQMGLTSVPYLQVDGGDPMPMAAANKWINQQEAR